MSEVIPHYTQNCSVEVKTKQSIFISFSSNVVSTKMEGRSDSQQEADTLLEVILHNCEKYADKTALHWVNEDCNVTEHYTYAEVKERTREIAAGLQQLLKEGPKTDPLTRERVILCYPPGLEFLLVFIASLRAGLIPGMCVFCTVHRSYPCRQM